MKNILCMRCYAIFEFTMPHSKPLPGTIINMGEHHDSASSFFNAVDSGCYICTALLSKVETNEVIRLQQSRQDWGFTMFSLSLSQGYLASKDDNTGEFDLLVRIDERGKFSGKLKEQLAFLPGRSFKEPQLNFILTKLSDLGTVWSEFESIRPGSKSSSHENVTLIKKWMDNCQRNHEKCKGYLSVATFRPKRLLYVGTSETPSLKLIDTSETQAKEPYATLSHCWGKHPIHRLLESNLRAMKLSIDCSDLPANFVDAIFMTRAIGIYYLWIDSLCIIQDSHTDWQQQAPLMCDIYRNSICNIAATKSHNSHEGLFVERRLPLQRPLTVDIAITDAITQEFVLVDHNYFSSRVDTAPLNTRCWVLQERYLSPRTVHFCFDQVLWECYEQAASEEYTKVIPEVLNSYHSKRALAKDATQKAAQGFWRTCLEKYTRCGLSFGSDKLVAISGIARSVQPCIGVEYLAGIWKLDCCRELLWRSEGLHLTQRRHTYRAPSWSWASIKGPIDQCYVTDYEDLISITDHSVTLATDDPFGQISDAYLRLSGRLIPCTATVSQQGIDFQTPSLPLLNSGDEINWDEMITSKEVEEYDMPIYYAPFLIREDEDDDIGLQVLGLILVEAKDRSQGCYTRVGVFSASQNEYNEETFFLDESEFKFDPILYEEVNGDESIYRII